PDTDADADAYACPRPGHRDCRGQPDRPTDFRCDRHIGKSHRDDEWQRRLYLPDRGARQLHVDRQRRPPLSDKHAVGECGAGSDGDAHRPAPYTPRSLVEKGPPRGGPPVCYAAAIPSWLLPSGTVDEPIGVSDPSSPTANAFTDPLPPLCA